MPVLCGAAFRNKVQPLLDAIVAYLLAARRAARRGTKPGSEQVVTRKADDNAPAALAFKLMSDKHVGHLTYIRVYPVT